MYTYTCFNDFLLDRITEVKPKPFTLLTLHKLHLQNTDSHLLVFKSWWEDEHLSKTLSSVKRHNTKTCANSMMLTLRFGYYLDIFAWRTLHVNYSCNQSILILAVNISEGNKRPCCPLTPGVLGSNPLCGSMVDWPFHHFEVDYISTRHFWVLSG